MRRYAGWVLSAGLALAPAGCFLTQPDGGKELPAGV